jgi:putative membrane protein
MNSFKITVAAAAIASFATAAPATAQPKMSPQEFVSTAGSSDMLELQSSQMALEKGQSAAVKEFAQMMIKDHTAASAELKAAAEKDGVAVPTEIMPKHGDILQKLTRETGDDFDEAYIDAQVDAHEEAVELMTSYAEMGEGATKAHAAKTAPIIQMHLEHVQKIEEGM